VKILQDVQEELVQQSVFFLGDEDGHGAVIVRLDAVILVVLLEVEQATCMKSQLSCEPQARELGGTHGNYDDEMHLYRPELAGIMTKTAAIPTRTSENNDNEMQPYRPELAGIMTKKKSKIAALTCSMRIQRTQKMDELLLA
jgi:hypothetical protein